MKIWLSLGLALVWTSLAFGEDKLEGGFNFWKEGRIKLTSQVTKKGEKYEYRYEVKCTNTEPTILRIQFFNQLATAAHKEPGLRPYLYFVNPPEKTFVFTHTSDSPPVLASRTVSTFVKNPDADHTKQFITPNLTSTNDDNYWIQAARVGLHIYIPKSLKEKTL